MALDGANWAPLVGLWVLSGIIGGCIAGSRGNKGGFLLGFLLGPIGWIIAAIGKSPEPVAAPTALERINRRPDDLTPAWHPDPLGRFDARWWDGNRWTQDVGRVAADGTRGQFEDPV